MDKVHPLNPLLDKISRYKESGHRALQWENNRVEWTLNRLGKKSVKKEILAGAGNNFLSFDDFNNHADFPIKLFAEYLSDIPPIHKNQKFIHPFWFKSFLRLPIVERYSDLFEKEVRNTDKPIGMVFPRKGFLQGLIIHNGDFEIYLPNNASCHLYRGSKASQHVLVVQPYAGLVDHIKKNRI